MKRDRLAVINDILKTISSYKNKIKPTPLLRYSNLSSQGFSVYISELLEKNLIEEVFVKKRKHYSLTKKGFKFIEKYIAIRGFIEDFGL